VYFDTIILCLFESANMNGIELNRNVSTGSVLWDSLESILVSTMINFLHYRVNGNQSRLITQPTKENGFTQKLITQSTKLMITYTDTQILVPLVLICGRWVII